MCKRLKLIGISLIAFITLSACSTIVPVDPSSGGSGSGEVTKKINVVPTKSSIYVNTTTLLSVSFEGFTDCRVTYTTKQPLIASVDSMGYVLGLKPGVADVTVTSVSTPSVFSTVQITVLSDEPTDILITSDFTSVLVDESIKLKASFYPEEAKKSDLIWYSDDENIATVDSDGTVTGVSNGNVDIHAKSVDNENLIGTFNLKVVSILVDEITLTTDKTDLFLDETATLYTTVLPKNASDSSLLFTISDPSILSFRKNVVTPLKVGSSTITFRSNDGNASESITYNVSERPIEPIPVHVDVTGINASFDKASQLDEITVDINQNVGFFVDVIPADATNKGYTVSINNDHIEYVNGYFHALSSGSSTIKIVSNENEELYKQLKINVNPAPQPEIESITLNEHERTIVFNEELTEKLELSVKFAPSGSSDTLIWETSDPNIATVSNGVVTAKSVGDVEIFVRAENHPSLTDSCLIHFIKPVDNVSLNCHELNLLAGNSSNLTFTISPEDATNKKVSWSSSNEDVAKVDSDGNVTAVGNGDATITIITEDGAKTDYCDVHVTTPVNNLIISMNDVTLTLGETCDLSVLIDPSLASNKGVIWSVNSEKVTLNSTTESAITITAVGVTDSPVIITCTSDENKEIYDTCSVTVKPVYVNKIEISADATTLFTDERIDVSVVVNPDDADDKTYTWVLNDPSIAHFEGNTLIPDSKGEVTVHALSNDAGGCTSNSLTFLIKERVTSLSIAESEEGVVLYPENDQGKPNTKDLTLIFNNGETMPSDTRVTWLSSNTDVAIVDKTGKVSAKALGKATIVCTSIENSEIFATCEINVLAVDVLPILVEVTNANDKHFIDINEEITLNAQVLPKEAKQEVSWSVNDDSIVSISPNGATCNVKGLMSGTAVIKATTSNGKIGEYSVIVNALDELNLTVNNNTLLMDTISKAKINDLDISSSKQYLLSSGDTSVVEITNNNEIKSVGKGKTYVYVTDTISGKVSNSVIISVGDLCVSQEEMLLKHNLLSDEENYQQTLFAYLDTGVIYTNVSWEIADDSIAIIDDFGLVTPKKAGQTTITCRSKDNPNIYKTIDVTVEQFVTSIEFETPTASMTAGEVLDPIILINPTDATNKKYSFTSDKESVVKVDENTGKLVAVGIGTANIHVTSCDELGVSCTVDLSITVNKGENPITINENQSWATNYSETAVDHSLEPAEKAEGEVTYSITSQPAGDYFSISDNVVTMSPKTPVGTYQLNIDVSAAGNDNFYPKTVKVNLTVIVSKADNPMTIDSIQELDMQYSSNSVSKDFVGASNYKGEITYSIISQPAGNYFSVNGNTITMSAETPISTYTITMNVHASGNSNYKEKDIQFKINVDVIKGINPISYTNDNKSSTYSLENSQVALNVASGAAGNVSYELVSVKLNKTDVTNLFSLNNTVLTINGSTNTGTYVVTVRANASGNDLYEPGHADSVFNLTIGKANNPIKLANQDKETTYSDAGSDIVINGATNVVGSTQTYSITSQPTGNYFSINGTKITAKAETPAGTYSLTVKVEDSGNNNYNSGYATATIKITVKKATNPISVTTPLTWNPAYSTSPQSFTITGVNNAIGGATYQIISQLKNQTAVNCFSIEGSTLTVAGSTGVADYVVVVRVTANKDGTNANYTSEYKDITINVNFKKVTNIVVNVSSTSIKTIGGTVTINSVTISPNDACQLYELTTSNNKVLKINGNTVTSVGAGKADIIATASDGSGVQGKVTITVAVQAATAPSKAQVQSNNGYTWDLQAKNIDFADRSGNINSANVDIGQLPSSVMKTTLVESNQFGNNGVVIASNVAGTTFVFNGAGTGNLDISGNYLTTISFTYYCEAGAAMLLILDGSASNVDTHKVIGGVTGIQTTSFTTKWLPQYTQFAIYCNSASPFRVYFGSISVSQTVIPTETKITTQQLLDNKIIWDMHTYGENIDGSYGKTVSSYGDPTMQSALAGYNYAIEVKGNASHIFSGLTTSNVVSSPDPAYRYELAFEVVYYSKNNSAFNVILNGASGVAFSSHSNIGNNVWVAKYQGITTGFVQFDIYSNGNPNFDIFVACIRAQLIKVEIGNVTPKGRKVGDSWTITNNGGTDHFYKATANLGDGAKVYDHVTFVNESTTNTDYDYNYYLDKDEIFEAGCTYKIVVNYYIVNNDTNGGGIYIHLNGGGGNAFQPITQTVGLHTYEITRVGQVSTLAWYACAKSNNGFRGTVIIKSITVTLTAL